MNIVILLGAPGSGKGTVAGRLASEHDNLRHVSSGDLLRGAVAKGTAAGQEAKGYMDAGKLVPDALIATMIKDVVAETTGDVTMLLDGADDGHLLAHKPIHHRGLAGVRAAHHANHRDLALDLLFGTAFHGLSPLGGVIRRRAAPRLRTRRTPRRAPPPPRKRKRASLPP